MKVGDHSDGTLIDQRALLNYYQSVFDLNSRIEAGRQGFRGSVCVLDSTRQRVR